MMNYDGWFRIECHAGHGCDNFGPSGFRKDAVEFFVLELNTAAVIFAAALGDRAIILRTSQPHALTLRLYSDGFVKAPLTGGVKQVKRHET